MTLHTVLKIDETENPLSFYTRDAVILLSTTIYAGTHGYVTSGGDEVQSAAFFVTTPTGNHTWSGNITDVLTSYMQNVSLSFLSDDVTTGFSNATATKPFYVNSTCVSTFTVYAYDPIRLLSSYGIALAVAFLTLVHGCGLILRNGAEEKLVLSHIFRFAVEREARQHLRRGARKDTSSTGAWRSGKAPSEIRQSICDRCLICSRKTR